MPEDMTIMDSSGGDGGKLPFEIIERMLSFLPVPALRRMRSVCKSWNELIARPSFNDLCDLNGRSDVYFMWRENFRGLHSAIEPIFTRTLSFLDLDAQRWYSIQTTELPRICAYGNEIETLVMAMDNGLVCELTSLRETDDDYNYAVTLSDPVAKMRRELPVPPEFYSHYDCPPKIVMVVDNATRSYKVFLFCKHWDDGKLRAYLCEAFTNEWRGLGNVINEVEELWATSAVYLHQSVFLLNRVDDGSSEDGVLGLLSHIDLQGDLWTEVWRMSFPRILQDPPQLLVSDNCLIVTLWALDPASTNQDCPCGLLEIYEILVAEKSRKLVVQLSDAQLRQIFETHDNDDVDVAYGVSHKDTPMGCATLSYWWALKQES